MGASLVNDQGSNAQTSHVPRGEPTDADLAHLVRGLADAIVVCDRRGRIVFWNAAATRIFGWTADEAIGESLDLIIPERYRARHWAGYDRVMETGTTTYGDRLLEVPAQHRSGATISIAFTVSLLRRSDGEVWAIAAVVRDETARWQEQRAVRRELAQLRSAADEPGK